LRVLNSHAIAGNLPLSVLCAKAHLFVSAIRQLFFVTLSLIYFWLFREEMVSLSTSGFSLQVYEVNFCKTEKRILPLQT